MTTTRGQNDSFLALMDLFRDTWQKTFGDPQIAKIKTMPGMGRGRLPNSGKTSFWVPNWSSASGPSDARHGMMSSSKNVEHIQLGFHFIVCKRIWKRHLFWRYDREMVIKHKERFSNPTGATNEQLKHIRQRKVSPLPDSSRVRGVTPVLNLWRKTGIIWCIVLLLFPFTSDASCSCK